MDEMFGGDEMQEILHDFLVENEELLDSIDQQLIELEENPEDQDLLNSVFRSLHTIKGASGFLGLTQLVEVAHKGENILDKLRQGTLKLTSARMDVLLGASDMLRLLANHIKEKDGIEEDTSALMEALLKSENGDDEDISAPEEAKEATPAPSDAPEDLPTSGGSIGRRVSSGGK